MSRFLRSLAFCGLVLCGWLMAAAEPVDLSESDILRLKVSGVTIGMSRRQVKLVLGAPNQTEKNDTFWLYHPYSSTALYVDDGSIYWHPHDDDLAVRFWLPPNNGVDRVAGSQVEFSGKVLLRVGDPSQKVTEVFGPAGKHRAESPDGAGYNPEWWEWWFTNGPHIQLQVVASRGRVSKIVLARHWRLDPPKPKQ